MKKQQSITKPQAKNLARVITSIRTDKKTKDLLPVIFMGNYNLKQIADKLEI